MIISYARNKKQKEEKIKGSLRAFTRMNLVEVHIIKLKLITQFNNSMILQKVKEHAGECTSQPIKVK